MISTKIDAYLEVFKRLARFFASLQQRCVQSWHLVRTLPISRGPWLKEKIILIYLHVSLNSNIIATTCYVELNILFSQGFLAARSVNGGIPLIPQTQKPSRRDQDKICRGGAGCELRPPVLAVLLVLTLDQAQFALQALELGQQAAVVVQQLAVLLDESR